MREGVSLDFTGSWLPMAVSILWGEQSWTMFLSQKIIASKQLKLWNLRHLSWQTFLQIFGSLFFFLDCCQKENAKLNKYKNLQLFWSVLPLPILHTAMQNTAVLKLVSLQHRRKREIAIDASCFKSPNQSVVQWLCCELCISFLLHLICHWVLRSSQGGFSTPC